MRKLLTLTLASTAIVAIACSKKTPVTAMSDDLKRDLKLASTTQDIRINPDEITEAAKPTVALKPKKAPTGPRVVRSAQPTVMASAAPVEAAEIKSEVPDVQVTAPAPTESAPEAPPLARPSAIPVSNSGQQGRADGNGGSGAGGGSVWGGIFGAVIRGGVVGDDDHCDPRSTMPRGRAPTDIGVYRPNPMGGMGMPRGGGGIRPMVRGR